MMHWTTWSLIPLWTTCSAAAPDSAAAPALDYAAALAGHREKCLAKPNSAFCWMDNPQNVDATCRFAARVGLAARGPSPVGPRLDLRFGTNERWAAVPHELTGRSARAFAKQPRLCALSSGEPYEGPSPSLLLIANDVDYVFRLWLYFVNKALWASSTKHRLSVWIGELPKLIAAKSGDGCRASKQKRQFHRSLAQSYYGSAPAKSSNHHAKMLAAYRLLEDPQVTGLYYVDMDAYVSPSHFGTLPTLFRKAHTDDTVDVLFENARDSQLFWHLHGDSFYLRDVALSRIFLKEWLERRCGFKDQYSLWHAVLGLAGAAGCLQYEGEIYSNFTYQEALHIQKAEWKQLKLSCGGRQKRCPAFRFCRDKYDLAHQHFRHDTVDALATRRFRYEVGGGWRADVVVADQSGGDLGDDDAVDKSGLLGAVGLLHVGAATVLGRLPPPAPPAGVSLGWVLFLLPGALVVVWRCRRRRREPPRDAEPPRDEAFSAYGTRRPVLRKVI